MAEIAAEKTLAELLSSPDALESISEHERARLKQHVLARLGANFSRSARSQGAALFFTHVASGIDLSLIPGGRLEMGARASDIAEVARHIDLDLVSYSIDADSESALPAHWVSVQPFLCARVGLPEGTMARADALERVRSLGFRLPSEAELEWILRDGDRYALTLGATPVPGRPGAFDFKPSRYGIEQLLIANWAADDWHPTYQGVPATSAPWFGGDPEGVCRSTFSIPAMVSEEDITVLLASIRTRGSPQMPCIARLTKDLPLD